MAREAGYYWVETIYDSEGPEVAEWYVGTSGSWWVLIGDRRPGSLFGTRFYSDDEAKVLSPRLELPMRELPTD